MNHGRHSNDGRNRIILLSREGGDHSKLNVKMNLEMRGRNVMNAEKETQCRWMKRRDADTTHKTTGEKEKQSRKQ